MMNLLYARKQLPCRQTEGYSILHLGQRRAFLNDFGTKVWNLIDGRRRASEIAVVLAEEYEMPNRKADQIFPKIETFLHRLYAGGFLRRLTENGGSEGLSTSSPRGLTTIPAAEDRVAEPAPKTLHSIQEVCMTPGVKIDAPIGVEDRVQQLYWEKNYIQKMHLELTYRCNFRCPQCYNTTHGGGTSELNTDEWMSTLDQLAGLGCWLVTFTGGEAFVRRDFVDILRYASEKGFSININTNGSLIDEKALTHLEPLKHYLQAIDISVYGADSLTHDTISSRPGSFYTTRRALLLLRDAGLPVLAKFITMRDNFDGVELFEEEMGKLNIPYLVSTGSLIPQTNRDTKPLVQLLTNEQYRKLMSARTTEGFSRVGSCKPGHVRGAVTPDGHVSPCEWLTDLKYGNVREQPLREIWYSTGFLKFRRRFEEEHSECPSCELRPGCARCPAHSYLETGDIFKCAPVQRNQAEICRDMGVAKL